MSKSVETYNSFMIINNVTTIEVLKFDLDKYQKYGCLSIFHISLVLRALREARRVL